MRQSRLLNLWKISPSADACLLLRWMNSTPVGEGVEPDPMVTTGDPTTATDLEMTGLLQATESLGL